jgi:two-component system OmpR family sensor kinase
VTIRRRLVLMSVAVFVVVLVAAAAVAMGLLRSRLIDDVDASLVERRAAVERLADLVSIDQLAAQQPSQIDEPAFATLALKADGSILAALPSGPPDNPDALPILEASDIERLLANSDPFTVDGAEEGYRVVGATVRGGEVTLVLAQPLDDVARTLRRVLFAFGVVGLGAAVVLGAVIGLLIRRELRPLETMAETADRITEGALTERVPIERASNEVGRLGGALNSMLGRIEEEMVARTASEHRMRRFVADASHELRTPLTSIRGYAELYRAGADTPDQVSRSFERIEREAERMGGLVDDLVLLARLDQERPFTTTDVDMAAVVRDAAIDARAVEPDRPLITRVGNGSMVVSGDADRLRQVVANLLGNVRAHTDPGTPAEVRLDRSGDSIVVAVSDEGPGIGTNDAEQAFERFYQASPDRSTPGSGLGLSIVRSIVERHGGTVELETRLGEGTTVRMHFPAA